MNRDNLRGTSSRGPAYVDLQNAGGGGGGVLGLEKGTNCGPNAAELWLS